MEEHQPTELRKWIDEPGKRRSIEKLAASLRRRGRHASVDYLDMIASGYYPPGRKLSLLLSKETGIPVAALISYPYRAPRAA